MAYSERVKRKLPNKDNQYGLVYFPLEESYSVVCGTKIHYLGDDYSANYIIINNKSFDVEVLARGTKEYCEKKAAEFKTHGEILKSSDESQKLRTKIISRSPSPNNKRSKSSINIQSKTNLNLNFNLKFHLENI